MITIEAALVVLATAPMVLAAILAVCAAGMNRAPAPASPGAGGGPWYPRTHPPLPNTAPLPTAALPCLQETWVREVMAQIEADSAGIIPKRRGED